MSFQLWNQTLYDAGSWPAHIHQQQLESLLLQNGSSEFLERTKWF